MTHSMTAFAKEQVIYGAQQFCWELKSVNHRYLDVSFRLPEAMRSLEIPLRQALQGQISRGKLECHLKVTNGEGKLPAIKVDKGLVQALLGVADHLHTTHQLANDLTVSHLLAWPGVVLSDQEDGARTQQCIIELFNQAVTQLAEVRLTEGKRLKDCLETRIHCLQQEITAIQGEVTSFPARAREKLQKRLEQLQCEVISDRVEQELALMLTKLDVAEEIDRIKIHMQEVLRALNSDVACGRHLDFLMQELNREANTLCAKSDCAVLTQHAVQMKVIIEQMREQVQNIE